MAWQLNQTRRQTASLKIQIRQNLSSVDHIEPWKRVLKKRVRSTAEWLTQEPAFHGWKNNPETAILWCSGTLGMGKTVLMSNVVSQLHRKSENIAHFFCLAENESSLTARNIIGSISRQRLHSLIEQSNHESLSSMQSESCHLDTNETVEFLLTRLVPERTYYIVLDGLDECNLTQIRALDSAIDALTKSPVAKLKILCTGRPDLEDDLFGRTRPQYRVVIDEGKVHLDIDRYIVASLDDCLERKLLVLRDPTNITRIVDVLRDNSQGMFLWVSLCIGELCEQNCDEDILHALQHLPRTLAELFNAKIRRIQGGPKHIQAMKLIQFCGVMKRPLIVEEYREVLSISKDDKALNMAKIPNNIHRIVRGCYGLTFIDEEEDTIHFIHQSVKDHLFYTNFGRTALLEAAMRQNWKSVQILIDAGVYLDRNHSEGETNLHMASRQNAVEAVSSLVSAGFSLDARNANMEMALHLATYKGHINVVQCLAAAGADLDSSNNQNEATLHVAAQKGAEEIVRTLVSAGASISIMDSRFETALHVASFMGHISIVQCLLAGGADINRFNIKDETTLHIATAQRRLEIMKVFIAAGADLNLRNRKGETALHIAKGSRGLEEETDIFQDDGPFLEGSEDETALNRVGIESADAAEILMPAGADSDSDSYRLHHNKFNQ
ncbi:uncharacterized protein N7483_002115 [Penicillium malachiteum]|uniref:uncharacterized protein n=1 Tax=Penicillium malachiteum TaxID=1324776 RepID=UPI002546AFDB|nr:uncharacterized protein N7483_002115 [Penicillium malachiteum]KAJ5736990.1 hypothetical protein N7483_002115 [Penicillium malachiteum]